MEDEVTLEDLAIDYEFKGWTSCVNVIHRFIEKHEEAVALNAELLEVLEYLLTRLESVEDIRIAEEAIDKAKGETG